MTYNVHVLRTHTKKQNTNWKFFTILRQGELTGYNNVYIECLVFHFSFLIFVQYKIKSGFRRDVRSEPVSQNKGKRIPRAL